MKDFVEADLMEAYRMLSECRTAIIATKGAEEGLYNLTPYGWFMPMDYEPVTKVIISSDPAHQAAINIKRTGTFALCIPSDDQAQWVTDCGSVSAPDADKFALFKIPAVKACKTDLCIPAPLLSGWIECRLIKALREGSVLLIMGEAVGAYADARLAALLNA